ncbi:DUF2321 domain-containing protein [Lactobacillus jensenii]|uniref:DUF2321 domain-containing protein n=1 Tax=Lactobacillus jensenii TaxID=109790 RepID=UPI00164835BA|nr:DUF2321 domain-containing protein [Lactobacillus jensenii]
MIIYNQLVCLNGHKITDSATANESQIIKFCEKCGAKTIEECPNCHKYIEGNRKYDDIVLGYTGPKEIPAYCKFCSNPFPWTQASMNSMTELIQLSDLNSNSKEVLKNTIPDMMVETPRTQLSAVKWKTIGKPILEFGRGSLLMCALRLSSSSCTGINFLPHRSQ